LIVPPTDTIRFVLKSDIYLEASRGNQAIALANLCRELPAVPETVPPIQLFERFLKQRQQIMLAVDEHGGVAGILTMEDIIETLLGMEIVDETDTVADMRALARQQWLKRARSTRVEKVSHLCGIYRCILLIEKTNISNPPEWT
jgi:CBS domain containing-hemolysin-like protein